MKKTLYISPLITLPLIALKLFGGEMAFFRRKEPLIIKNKNMAHETDIAQIYFIVDSAIHQLEEIREGLGQKNKVIAINPCKMSSGEETLTVGKTYQIVDRDGAEMAIMDDQGDEHWFKPEHIGKYLIYAVE